MREDIYFATNRLTISNEESGGRTITPNAECGIERAELLELFKRNHHITLLAADEAEAERVLRAFAAQFSYVVAAGGVVEREDGRILMIFRNGRWDLPKGHWEEGESIEECAVREVEEESGVGGITLGKEVARTLHAYYLHGRWELKRTHWYAMSSSHSSPLYPQTEEGIERAEWLSREEVAKSLTGSFPTIVDVMRNFYSSK